MRKKILELSLCWFVCSIAFDPAIAEERRRSGPQIAQSSEPSPGLVHREHLGCLNRLQPPVVGPNNSRFNDSDDLEEDRTFFYGTINGQKGFFVVASSAVTFDRVPVYLPKENFPGYLFKVRNLKGKETFYQYNFDEKRQQGEFSYGSAEAYKRFDKDFDPNRAFRIGTSSAKVSKVDAIGAIENEVFLRLDDIPKYLNEREHLKNFHQLTKDALCACIKIENQKIESKVMEVAKKLRFSSEDQKELQKCAPPLVGQLKLPGQLQSVPNNAALVLR